MCAHKRSRARCTARMRLMMSSGSEQILGRAKCAWSAAMQVPVQGPDNGRSRPGCPRCDACWISGGGHSATDNRGLCRPRIRSLSPREEVRERHTHRRSNPNAHALPYDPLRTPACNAWCSSTNHALRRPAMPAAARVEQGKRRPETCLQCMHRNRYQLGCRLRMQGNICLFVFLPSVLLSNRLPRTTSSPCPVRFQVPSSFIYPRTLPIQTSRTALGEIRRRDDEDRIREAIDGGDALCAGLVAPGGSTAEFRAFGYWRERIQGHIASAMRFRL